MSNSHTASLRYKYSAKIANEGVELVQIEDAVGAQVDKAVRGIVKVFNDERHENEDFLGATKSLRWRLLTHPQPLGSNESLKQSASAAITEVKKIAPGTVGISHQVLSDFTFAAELTMQHDSPVGPILLQSLKEVGPRNCVVIAASSSAAAGMASWLAQIGTNILTPQQLSKSEKFFEQAYAVGPPRFFPVSVLNAPMAEALTYLVPSWFTDRSLPTSVLTQYAEGTTSIEIRLHRVGVTEATPGLPVSQEPTEDDLLPRPVWKIEQTTESTADDTVSARHLLLAGNRGILLDDGERIRTLDPSKPRGERVGYIHVHDVIVGTYLLLRDGRTERQVIYDAAVALLGDTAPAIVRTQSSWKEALRKQLQERGHTRTLAELSSLGLSTLDRVEAWVDPTLVAPNSPVDFEILLRWLHQPVAHTVENAYALRRARAQVSSNMASLLEDAIASNDLSDLHRNGVLQLSHTDGFRGVLATRVLAISQHQNLVSRSAVRVLFKDWGAQWLG